MFEISRWCAPVSGLMQIRMLGEWQVNRSDGSLVDPREWRTGKTADLVRILALAGERPVPTARMVEMLWPLAPLARGLASLRTAASQIRHVLGPTSVERSNGGLALTAVWTDVVAFRALADEARACTRIGDYIRATHLARASDALYSGDLHTYDADAEWATEARGQLIDEHRALLVHATEAAAASGDAGDAVEFAVRVLERDPFCERASRSLMAAYAVLGETSSALWEYERIRALVSSELGADPSPQTTALYLAVLRGETVSPHDRQVPA